LEDCPVASKKKVLERDCLPLKLYSVTLTTTFHIEPTKGGVMKHLSIILAIVVLCAVPAVAQNWTAEQKEVIAAVKKCNDLWSEAVMKKDMNHYVSQCEPEDTRWWSTDKGVPDDRADLSLSAKLHWPNLKSDVNHDFDPVAVRIHGNMAFIYHYDIWVQTNVDGNKSTFNRKNLWIYQKQGDKWVYIEGMSYLMDDTTVY